MMNLPFFTQSKSDKQDVIIGFFFQRFGSTDLCGFKREPQSNGREPTAIRSGGRTRGPTKALIKTHCRLKHTHTKKRLYFNVKANLKRKVTTRFIKKKSKRDKKEGKIKRQLCSSMPGLTSKRDITHCFGFKQPQKMKKIESVVPPPRT